MLSKVLFRSLCLLLSLFIISCESVPDTSTEFNQEFVYMEGLCCQNLQSISNVELPDECKPDFDLFFPINLEEFNIADLYNLGDTLSISWDFTDDCEAQEDQFDCIITCDMRHGVPIKITSVN